MIYFLIIVTINILGILYFVFRKNESPSNKMEVVKFIIDNSQKVFTGIIVFMLIIFTFVQAFLRVVFDYMNLGKTTQERFLIDLVFFKANLLATTYDLVNGIFICMILLYFNHIVVYLLKSKLSLTSQNLTNDLIVNENLTNNSLQNISIADVNLANKKIQSKG